MLPLSTVVILTRWQSWRQVESLQGCVRLQCWHLPHVDTAYSGKIVFWGEQLILAAHKVPSAKCDCSGKTFWAIHGKAAAPNFCRIPPDRDSPRSTSLRTPPLVNTFGSGKIFQGFVSRQSCLVQTSFWQISSALLPANVPGGLKVCDQLQLCQGGWQQEVTRSGIFL